MMPPLATLKLLVLAVEVLPATVIGAKSKETPARLTSIVVAVVPANGMNTRSDVSFRDNGIEIRLTVAPTVRATLSATTGTSMVRVILTATALPEASNPMTCPMVPVNSLVWAKAL